MTLEELNAVLKIINDDLGERIAINTPAELYEFIQNKSYTVRDILDKSVLNIDFKPGSVVPIMERQKIPHYVLTRYYPDNKDEAIDICKKQITHSIADCPDFKRYIQFTTEDDYEQKCTVVTGVVLIAKHL